MLTKTRKAPTSGIVRYCRVCKQIQIVAIGYTPGNCDRCGWELYPEPAPPVRDDDQAVSKA